MEPPPTYPRRAIKHSCRVRWRPECVYFQMLEDLSVSDDQRTSLMSQRLASALQVPPLQKCVLLS